VVGFSPNISVKFNHCTALIFIDMLLLSEGQTGEVYEPYKSNANSEISGAFDIQVLIILVFKTLKGRPKLRRA
jgi:hypothetical protein